MPDFLDEKVKEIDARLKELRPLVDEFNRLEAARNALSGVEGNGGASAPSGRRRGPGRPRGSGSGSGGGRRRGRPRGGTTRGTQALELVRARPGITIREMAEAMAIQPNYLYRILPQLEQEGKVKREGKGWHASDGADS
jgi:hypothetical protein